jgi:hypothetical protein
MVNSLNDGLSTPDVLASGATIQAGTSTASNVAVNVTFSETFAATPIVTLGVGESGALAVGPGTLVDANAGSFQFLGTSGVSYNWNAFNGN